MAGRWDFDDDERGGGSIFGGGGGKGSSRRKYEDSDSLDNLGSTQRRGGGGGRGRGGGGRRDRDRGPGGVFVKGTIIELRLDKGFGFIRPQTLGTGGDEVFLHFGSGLAPGVSAKELVVGMEVTFIIGENEEGRARAKQCRIAPPPDPLASLRPAGMEAPIGRRGGGGGRGGAGAWGSGGNIRDIQRQQTTQNRHVSAAARFGGKLNTAPLLLLLRATSPEVVDRVFEASFRNRKALQLPAEEAMMTAKELKIDKPPKVHAPPRNSAQFLRAILVRNPPTRLRASPGERAAHVGVFPDLERDREPDGAVVALRQEGSGEALRGR